MSVEQWRREVDRCRAEVAEIERLLLAGHADVEGLCLALADWSAEMRILDDAAPEEQLQNAAAGLVH